MTRVSESQIHNRLIANIINNREDVFQYSDEVSSGYKVSLPGDSRQAGTVSEFRDTLARVETYKDRIDTTGAFLNFQEEVLEQVSDLLIRAKELAQQGGNETLNTTQRTFLASEVHQLREQLVNLTNSTWQGRYVFSGAADNSPTYSRTTDFTIPATGGLEKYRYAFTAAAGGSTSRTVQVTNDVSMVVTTPGSQLFNDAVYALERLGRALDGYRTLPVPPAAPDGTGTAYTFPQDYQEQSDDILETISLLDDARENDIMTERTDLAGRLRRLETAKAVISQTEIAAKEVLSRIQDADLVVSSSNLADAQTALEASLTVSALILRQQSLLDIL